MCQKNFTTKSSLAQHWARDWRLRRGRLAGRALSHPFILRGQNCRNQHVSARLPAPRSAGRRLGWCGGAAAARARARGGAGACLLLPPRRDARAERGVGQTFGEDRERLLTEHLNADPLSCGDPRRRGSCDPAEAAARGAHTPRSPAAAVAWLARSSFASSARFTKLTSLLLSRRRVCGQALRGDSGRLEPRMELATE